MCHESNKEINMMISGAYGKNKKIRVAFKRGTDFAEFIFPDIEVDKNDGFTESEIEQLKNYISENSKIIQEKAKEIQPLKNWMNEKI